ncbi:lumican-like [Erythrolamprus reginae]|uniref:lumican-like n=1 Tax=Erythrolamprus reginae TaxID=121349 RepID=UPI00396C506D
MYLISLPFFPFLISGIFCQYDYDDYSPDVQDFFPVLRVIYEDCAPECNCPQIYSGAMYCDDLKLKSIPIIPKGIKFLYLRNNLLEGIEENAFENVTDLEWLILDNNQLKNANIKGKVFAKLKNLKKLHINHNNLTEVVGPLPSSLDELQLTHNQIYKITPNTLEELVNLTVIHLQHNELTEGTLSGGFKGLKSLLYLDLSHNKLTKPPTGLPNNLLMLYLDNNQISGIPDQYFQGLKELQYLRLSRNKLTDSGIPSNIFNISSLVELDLSYNQLKSIPTVNEHLENYYLQNNQIAKFSVRSFCKVVGILAYSTVSHLRLDGNNIIRADLPQEMYNCLRVATDISLK